MIFSLMINLVEFDPIVSFGLFVLEMGLIFFKASTQAGRVRWAQG